MDVYRTDGTENLRADAKVKSGEAVTSPSAGGSDMGGKENMRADEKTFTGATNSTPGQKSLDRPKGVQEFNDDMGKN